MYFNKNTKKLNKFYTFSKNYKNDLDVLLNNNYLLNFVKFNKHKYLYSFFHLYLAPKFFNKQLSHYNYTNKVQNFYKVDLLNQNSYTMSLANFFNQSNFHLQLN
jgi:hypothetical protein